MTVTIYTLRDPNTGALRYVGKTVKPVYLRLNEHLAEARRRSHRYLSRWLNSLYPSRPFIGILENCDNRKWEARERYWIRKLRSEGCCLVNTTDGGEGFAGYRFTAAHKAKISKALIGRLGTNTGRHHSVETKQKIRRALIGKPGSFLGQKHSAEARRKISLALRGRTVSRQTRLRNRKATLFQFKTIGHPWQGKHLSEEHKAKLRKATLQQFAIKGYPFQGKHHSEATKKRLAGAKSETTKSKMRDAWVLRKARLRKVRPKA